MRRYSKDHVWVLVEEGKARIGISEYARRELGDIAYIELPEDGLSLSKGDVICRMDAMKSAGEIYSPVSGIVRETNGSLLGDGGLTRLNADPQGEGWMAVIEMSAPAELDLLLSESEYQSYLTGC